MVDEGTIPLGLDPRDRHEREKLVQAAGEPERGSYEAMLEAVRAFHKAHPEVWTLFERFALDRAARGFAHYSADAVMHRVRWETSGGDKTRGEDGFKINDHHVAFYARRFMRLHPELPGFFRTRRQTSR